MKQHDVIINGVKYLPENTSSTADKPFGEPEVNYRALVNDKLNNLDTFNECQDDEIEMGGENSLCLAEDSHANHEMFIIAGRIQEVLIEYAFFGGDNERPLYLTLNPSTTWKEVYDSLLTYEDFIKTGNRS